MKKTNSKKIKVCYVLSYKDPGYIRTRSIVKILTRVEEVELYKAINTYKNFFRYLDSLLRLFYIRVRYRPNVYILGFRGQEIFFAVRLLTIGKPLIFDEFINLNDWLVNEHKKIRRDSLIDKIIYMYMRLVVLSSKVVLSDTLIGVKYAQNYYKIDKRKFDFLYVGTDEGLFFKSPNLLMRSTKKTFNIFFYGSILPLHGIKYILEAAKNLRTNNRIVFTIVGGNKLQETKIRSFVNDNYLENIIYRKWVDFDELPSYINNADLCLGGPFGDTSQSNRVITGKTFQFLAMGKPVIVGRIKEEVGFKDKVNSLLVNQADSEDLVRTITWCYSNQSKLKSIGKAGNRLYIKKFSSRAQEQKLQVILLGVI